jgi:ATP-dependent helicase/nuclease subunit A
MTIHKAKGLEFPVVVLADASRRLQSRGEVAHLIEETGLAFKPDRLDGVPLAYGIAAAMDQEQSQAEENRLLYVALTRAKEKLVVSGHCTESSRGLKMDGWMKALGEVAHLDLDELVEAEGKWRKLKLEGEEVVGACLASDEAGDVYLEDQQPVERWPDASVAPLYKSLEPGRGNELDSELEEEPARDWRATGERVHPPAAAVGVIVHKALERWLFPGDEAFGRLIESVALNEGLVEAGQRKRAIRSAHKLLERFKGHSLYEEIDGAADRHHEIPYTRAISDGWSDSGVIDLIYRVSGQWKLIDFKADEVRNEESLEEAVDSYRPQIHRYVQAARDLLGTEVVPALCFLDCMGEVSLVGL